MNKHVRHHYIQAAQTFHNLGYSTFRKLERGSNFAKVGIEYMCVCVCVCVCVRARAVKYIHVCLAESNLNPNSNTLQPDRPQHYRLTVFVIAQQYSSATFDFFVF